MLLNSSSGFMQEFQSFTDTNHTKDKTVASIDWYPMQRGVVAHSCVKSTTLDEKIDIGPPVMPKSAMVVIWSFHDPINPQV
jgi:dynein intermediate chain 3, axonemal